MMALTSSYGLTRPQADKLAEITVEIHDRARQSGENYVAIGQRLIEAKAMLKHGEFLRWLEGEIGVSRFTANRMMNVAESFKSCTVQHLKPAALIALSKGTVPDSARQEAIERAASGENVTAEAAREIAAKHAGGVVDAPAAEEAHAREPPEGDDRPDRGLYWATEAINALKRITPDDRFRARAFEMVESYIRSNR